VRVVKNETPISPPIEDPHSPFAVINDSIIPPYKKKAKTNMSSTARSRSRAGAMSSTW